MPTFKTIDILPSINASVESLAEAIKKQNPDIDENRLLREITAAVERVGTGEPESIVSQAEIGSFVTDYNDGAPTQDVEYNLAGDIITTAYLQFHRDKNIEQALQTALSFFEAPDADQFIRAVSTSNAIAGGPQIDLPIEGERMLRRAEAQGEIEHPEEDREDHEEREDASVDPTTEQAIRKITASFALGDEEDDVETAENAETASDDDADGVEMVKLTPDQVRKANLASLAGTDAARTEASKVAA